MIEVYGNLWTEPGVKVITTNGYVKTNGNAVMGAGCALEAANKYKDLPKLLGARIRRDGNHVHHFHVKDKENIVYTLFTFPVKHEWHQIADLTLIERSAIEIMGLSRTLGYNGSIVIPRPGCGNGGLVWKDVKSVISPILDNRFKVITFKESE